MKPPPFAYAAPRSVDDCVALLGAHAGDARIIAGGQSLMPMLNLRLLRPAVVVDIGRIGTLDSWREEDGVVRVGAGVRQHALESDAALARLLPLMAEAAPFIGHVATRSRGTIVGSMCHADPAAELPVCALLLDADFLLRSRAGAKAVKASAFFLDALTTAVADDELVEAVRVPLPVPDAGYAFAEIARRHGDFALVSAAAVVEAAEGEPKDARVALGGVGRRPVCFGWGEVMAGGAPDRQSFAAFARDVAGQLEPGSDLHATADYRRAIAAVLVERTLATAADRAGLPRLKSA